MDNEYDPIRVFLDERSKAFARSQELIHERELAAIRARSHALVWTGTEEELAATIARWYKFGWIAATSLQDALQMSAIHFVRPDGTPAIKPQAAAIAALSTPTLEPEESREAFVKGILDSKGWSILDWANWAGVSHATAIDYLRGKTKPYRDTRLKLAKALGVPVERLPK